MSIGNILKPGHPFTKIDVADEVIISVGSCCQILIKTLKTKFVLHLLFDDTNGPVLKLAMNCLPLLKIKTFLTMSQSRSIWTKGHLV